MVYICNDSVISEYPKDFNFEVIAEQFNLGEGNSKNLGRPKVTLLPSQNANLVPKGRRETLGTSLKRRMGFIKKTFP